MSTEIIQPWEQKRTSESRRVEQTLQQFFEQVDAYRYNSASLRLRVIDSRFEGKSRADCDALVEAKLDELPLETQQDIINILTLAPSHFQEGHSVKLGDVLRNADFQDPSPDDL